MITDNKIKTYLIYFLSSLCLLFPSYLRPGNEPTEKQISSIGSSWSPIVSADLHGHIYSIWAGWFGLGWILYNNASSDYGMTWLDNESRILGARQIDAGTQYYKLSSDSYGHVYLAWAKNGGNLYFNYSSNYGNSWGSSKKLNPSSVRYIEEGEDALSISHDGKGRLYVLWKASERSELFLSSSINHGKDWISAKLFPNSLMKYYSAQISCDRNNVYIICERQTSGNNKNIYFTHSIDYGFHWSKMVALNSPKVSSANPCFAYDINGKLYAAWEGKISGHTDIYFSESSDYGKSWSRVAKRINERTSEGGGHFNPETCCDANGHVYLCWEDKRNHVEEGSSTDLYFNSSSDYGLSWLQEDQEIRARPSEDNMSILEKKIACDQLGGVYLSWMEHWESSRPFFFSFSQDYGDKWQQKQMNRLADGLTGFDMTKDNLGNIFFVWDSYVQSQGGQYIYFDRYKIQNVFPPVDIKAEKKINRNLFKKEAYAYISWTSNPDNASITIAKYYIYRKSLTSEQAAFENVGEVDGSTRQYIDKGLNIDERYAYAVVSVDDQGTKSEMSVSVSI